MKSCFLPLLGTIKENTSMYMNVYEHFNVYVLILPIFNNKTVLASWQQGGYLIPFCILTLLGEF